MYKLSPSDFAYLYEECKLCYCLKVKEKIYQPSMQMPGVFSTMNSIMQGSVVGRNLQTISKALPEGTVVKQEGFVESQVVPGTSLFIGGKYDLLVENPDGTHTVVDLKISKPSDGKAEMYQSQLWAYQYALEHPAKSEPITISKLALLIFYPDNVTFEDGVAKLSFPPQWLEISYDQEKFVSFMEGIDRLLTGPLPPEDPSCKWCAYRHIGERISHTEAAVTETDDAPF